MSVSIQKVTKHFKKNHLMKNEKETSFRALDNISFEIEDYPKAGTYKIEFAGYETTFEMKIYE